MTSTSGVHHGARRERLVKLGAQVGYLFGSNMLDRVLALVGSIVISRYLGASELGRFGPALVLGALVARFSDLGVSVILQRDVARAPQHARQLLARALGFRVFSTTVAAACLVMYALGTEGMTSRAWLPLLAGASALVTMWFQAFAFVWIGVLRSQYVAVLQAIYRLVYLALIALVVMLGVGSNLVMLVLLAAATVQLLVGIGVTRRVFFVPTVTVSLRTSAELLKESWPLGISSLTVMAYDRGDTLIASWFLAPMVVGNYFAAYAFYSATLTLSNAITSVAYSVFSRAASNASGLAGKYRKTLALTTGLGAIVSISILLTAPVLVRLVYGGKYTQAGSYLQILAVAVTFLFANNLACVTLNAMGRQRVTMMITAVGSIFNVGLNLALIPHFGIAAPAWLTVATEVGITIAACGIVERNLRQPGAIESAPAVLTDMPDRSDPEHSFLSCAPER